MYNAVVFKLLRIYSLLTFCIRNTHSNISKSYFIPKSIAMAPKRKAASTSNGEIEEKKSKRTKTKRVDSEEETEKEKVPSRVSKKIAEDCSTSTNGKDSATTDNFDCDAKTSDGKKWNFKISSWNVNGIRGLLTKHGLAYLKEEDPDVFCIQETKCSKEKIPPAAQAKGYTAYWLSGDKEGYSGVGIYTKTKPIKVSYGIGIDEHDKEGRVITAEYDKFYLVNAYVPNAGRGLVRLTYRMKWDKDFRSYLEDLDKKKPVVMCGDLNVSHNEIDLANPKSNKKNAGFTQEERDGFSELLSAGFIDSYRTLHPDVTGAYTFWTYMMGARARNVGWRLDYFVVSERLKTDVCESAIRSKVPGSDHCPVTLFLAV